ncbi:MAG: SprT family zinc-dependent metalloprotease [Pseudomonadota bacterium]
MSYKLIRSHRRKKTLSIQVERDATVHVRVPFHTPQIDIDRFLKEKNKWLQKIIGRQQKHNYDRPVRSFIPGERFPYLGENYILKIHERDDSEGALTFTGREFLLECDALRGGRILFHLWYQKQARVHLEERVRRLGRLLGLSPRGVAVNNARSRWGSCSPDDRLTFAWRLIMAPAEIIDYVVVHELCHMKIRNHSRDYWRLVEDVIPDYKKHKVWLKDNGHLLTL